MPRSSGWRLRPAAFVAAYVLDSRWGLNQGFDRYFDKFDLSRFERISLGEVQRPANEVIDEALRWLDEKKGGKFFAWIHLYDPHTPYAPPEPYKTRYPQSPYLGEIAFADSQLARLWDYLGRNGLRDDLFLVLAGDHGESLGEHGEGSHGFFIYQAALHVPLIFVTPFPALRGVISPETVALADIMPTVLEMSGTPLPPRVQGTSLVPSFFRPGSTRDRLVYAETFYPRYHFGWSDLRSVQDGRYKLILAPVPELYDLGQDPGETKNLVYLEKGLRRSLGLTGPHGGGLPERARWTSARSTRRRARSWPPRLPRLLHGPSKLQERSWPILGDKISVFNWLAQARESGLGESPRKPSRRSKPSSPRTPASATPISPWAISTTSRNG
jgi:arylsulfatase A-like enzyme